MKFNRYIFIIIFASIALFGSTASAHPSNNNAFITTSTGSKIGVGSPATQKVSPFIILPKETIKEKKDARIKQSITVLPSTSSTVVEIPFSFYNDEYLVIYKEDSGKQYNAGHIFNKKNESISLFFISTEKAQNKLKVTTNVKNKNILELKIETNKLLDPVTIDIEISSPDITTYFSKNQWITRGKLDSVSMIPSPYLLTSANYEISTLKRLDAWNKLVDLHKYDEKWSNISGLQNQFDCHFDFAKTKGEWNLEPARKNVGYFSTIMASCNPSTK